MNRVGAIDLPSYVGGFQSRRHRHRWLLRTPSSESSSWVHRPPPPPYDSSSASVYHHHLPLYPAQRSAVVGWTLIAVGIVAISCNAVGLVVADEPWSTYGHGFWGGAAFVVTGSYGVLAATIKARCIIMSFMVTSMVTSLMSIGVMSTAVVGTICNSHRDGLECRDRSAALNSGAFYHHRQQQHRRNNDLANDEQVLAVAMEACLVAVAVVAWIASTWSAAFCFRAVCSRSNSREMSANPAFIGDVQQLQPTSSSRAILQHRNGLILGQPFFTRGQLVPSAPYRAPISFQTADEYWNHPFSVQHDMTSSSESSCEPPAYADIVPKSH